jgi:hypothetical protein
MDGRVYPPCILQGVKTFRKLCCGHGSVSQSSGLTWT